MRQWGAINVWQLTMKRLLICLSLPLLAAARAAAAADVSGHEALALGALVAAGSPALARGEKATIAALANGNTSASVSSRKPITVSADAVKCSAGDVDITAWHCDLTFGKGTVTLAGLKAHEIFATLVEVGVPSDGAAGRIYESLTQLRCTLDPKAIAAHDGSGADCHFQTGS